jgi:hypothetical protein
MGVEIRDPDLQPWFAGASIAEIADGGGVIDVFESFR